MLTERRFREFGIYYRPQMESLFEEESGEITEDEKSEEIIEDEKSEEIIEDEKSEEITEDKESVRKSGYLPVFSAVCWIDYFP